MNAEQIKKLMDKATKGPWHSGRMGLICATGGKTIVSANIMSDTDCDFIAALPDIATTALAALERAESLEKWIELNHPKEVKWVREQKNGN